MNDKPTANDPPAGMEELLAQHRRNLAYLQLQAAQYGPDIPLVIHNALLAEQETIANLEQELAAAGISQTPEPTWQALVVDADIHWREIVKKNLNQLGGEVIEFDEIPSANQREMINGCRLVIIAPAFDPDTESETHRWIENVVNLGNNVPIILLTSPEDRDAATTLRQALRNHEKPTSVVVTIAKDTFDPDWFSKIIQHNLTHKN